MIIQIYFFLIFVERQNIHLHHCQSLRDCLSYVGYWNFDSWPEDGGLELSGFDRHGAAAFSWSAGGSEGVWSVGRSTEWREEAGGKRGEQQWVNIHSTSNLGKQLISEG